MKHSKYASPTTGQTQDTIFSLLSDPCRRDIVDVLAGRTSSVPLDDLAHRLSWGKPETEAASDASWSTRELRVALHHVHLPKLDDAGVVDYDTQAKTVTPSQIDEVVHHLRAAEDLR